MPAPLSDRRIRHARRGSMGPLSGTADKADQVVQRRGLRIDQDAAFTALPLSARSALRRLGRYLEVRGRDSAFSSAVIGDLEDVMENASWDGHSQIRQW